MKRLFLVENTEDLEYVLSMCERFNFTQRIILPVSVNDPHFYNSFEDERLNSWEYDKDFLEKRHYDWIFKFKEHKKNIKKQLEIDSLPYAESLLFFLTYRFGSEYRVFSDYLSNFCMKHQVEVIQIKNLKTSYKMYLDEISPLKKIKIGHYND